MENHVDYQNQASEDTRPGSSESRLLATVAEQRIFRRLLRLTLLQGVMIGITLILFGGLLYVLLGFIPFAFYPTSPIIYRLLGPLMMISFGLETILTWRVQRLRRQLPAFPLSRFSSLNDNLGVFNVPTSGLFFIWSGLSSVILLCFSPDLSVWGIIMMVGFAAILFSPLLWRKRRVAQQ